MHHRLPDRIHAHALICFLALTLYRVMRMRLKAKGHSASPKAALQILSRIQHNTTHIGEKTFKGHSKTNQKQMELFDALVILPVLTGHDRRTHAAIFSFMAGVTPPMPMLGRSLL